MHEGAQTIAAKLDERGRPQKLKLPMQDLGPAIGKLLDDFQTLIFERAKTRLTENSIQVDTWEDFEATFADGKSSFVWAHWDGTDETEAAIKTATKATIRCIPLAGYGPEPEPGTCIKSGAPSAQRVLFAKNY